MKSSISYCEWINVISLRNMALALTFIELDLRSTSSVDNLAQLQFIVVETKKIVKFCCVLRVEYFLLEMVFESDLLFDSHYILIVCRNNI